MGDPAEAMDSILNLERMAETTQQFDAHESPLKSVFVDTDSLNPGVLDPQSQDRDPKESPETAEDLTVNPMTPRIGESQSPSTMRPSPEVTSPADELTSPVDEFSSEATVVEENLLESGDLAEADFQQKCESLALPVEPGDFVSETSETSEGQAESNEDGEKSAKTSDTASVETENRGISRDAFAEHTSISARSPESETAAEELDANTKHDSSPKGSRKQKSAISQREIKNLGSDGPVEFSDSRPKRNVRPSLGKIESDMYVLNSLTVDSPVSKETDKDRAMMAMFEKEIRSWGPRLASRTDIGRTTAEQDQPAMGTRSALGGKDSSLEPETEPTSKSTDKSEEAKSDKKQWKLSFSTLSDNSGLRQELFKESFPSLAQKQKRTVTGQEAGGQGSGNLGQARSDGEAWRVRALNTGGAGGGAGGDTRRRPREKPLTAWRPRPLYEHSASDSGE